MKVLALAFLLFASHFCFSQEIITVSNERGQKLADVSVFELMDKNTLLGITDSVGNVSITLNEDRRYLFHLLGYIDQILTIKDLKKLPIVKLMLNVHQLNEVVVKSTKSTKLRLINKPGKYILGENNSIRSTFERVVPLKIEKAGFLSEFSLYAKQNFDGEVRKFRFILLNAVNGVPGNFVINYNVTGTLKGEMMIFNLDTLGTFIDRGDYFIGYETQNNGRSSDYLKLEKTKSGIVPRYPVIFVKGKSVSYPNAYVRNNFNEWQLVEIKNNKGGKMETTYTDFGYQLEMRIPLPN